MVIIAAPSIAFPILDQIMKEQVNTYTCRLSLRQHIRSTTLAHSKWCIWNSLFVCHVQSSSTSSLGISIHTSPYNRSTQWTSLEVGFTLLILAWKRFVLSLKGQNLSLEESTSCFVCQQGQLEKRCRKTLPARIITLKGFVAHRNEYIPMVHNSLAKKQSNFA